MKLIGKTSGSTTQTCGENHFSDLLGVVFIDRIDCIYSFSLSMKQQAYGEVMFLADDGIMFREMDLLGEFTVLICEKWLRR